MGSVRAHESGGSDRRAEPAALWASAAILAGLLIVQAGRTGGPSAFGEMVTRGGGYSVMTTAAQSDELLYVVDDRSESLMVYRLGNRKDLSLLYKDSLPELFTAARLSSGAR